MIKLVYAYATGDRADGLTAAVGAQYVDGRVDGSVALFRDERHAIAWATTFAESHAAQVEILPSLARRADA